MNSEHYWIDRYNKGGNSGKGSYDRLALFKAEVINNLITAYDINSIIDFGCGDGNQLSYLLKRNYIGFDISPVCVMDCQADYPHYTFRLMKEYNNQTAELTMSLDVIYHLLEDEVFDKYMTRLFAASTKFVIIYSSNHTDNENMAEWVKHRKFTDWVEANAKDYELFKEVKNKYPYIKGMNSRKARNTSVSDFYIYKKKANV